MRKKEKEKKQNPGGHSARERKFRGAGEGGVGVKGGGGTKTWKTRTPGVEHGAGTLKGPGRSVSFPQRLDDEPVTELEKSGVGLSGWSCCC